jgi:hypothetical protein
MSTAELISENATIPMKSVEKSAEDFEQEVLFAHKVATTDAEMIQRIVESKYFPDNLKRLFQTYIIEHN